MKLERTQIFALYFLNSLGILFYLYSLLISPVELSYGILSWTFLWFCFNLIPVLLPLLFETKYVRIVTIIIGSIIFLIQLAISYSYFYNNQILLGGTFLLYWGGTILSALYKTFKWRIE